MGDTHPPPAPRTHPSQGLRARGDVTHRALPCFQGCLGTESCTKQGGIAGFCTHQRPPWPPCPCRALSSPHPPPWAGQGQARRGRTEGAKQPRPFQTSQGSRPSHPGDSQGRDRGISSSVGEAQGQQAQGRREELAECLFYKAFNSLY